MAYYNNQTNQIEHFKSTPSPYKGWEIIDCGCCAGLEWGGEQPRDCRWYWNYI